jgi:hypothetical protein
LIQTKSTYPLFSRKSALVIKGFLFNLIFLFMTWRENARPIIAKVLADNKDKSEKEIRVALRNAYPYGERAMHPYKIWCDEIKVQRNQKKKHNHNFDFNQTDLFKESEVDNG